MLGLETQMVRRRNPKARLFIVLGTVVYLIILHVTSRTLIAPYWSYLGFLYVSPHFDSALISWVLALLPALWMPVALQRPSQSLYWLLYLLVYVPIMMMSYYAPNIEPSLVLTFQLCILFAFIMLYFFSRLPFIRLAQFQLPPSLFWYAIFMLTALFVGFSIQQFGFQLRIVDLLRVHTLRFEYEDIVATSGNLAAYFMFWQANVITPLIIARGMMSRRPLLVALGVIIQLLLFSIGGHRTILFSVIFIPGLVLVSRNAGRSFGPHLLAGFIGITIFAAIADGLVNAIPPPFTTTITRRLILAPGVLSGFYLDFFSRNSKAMLGWSFLRDLVHYPYDRPPSYLIGNLYLHDPRASANANFWADAYANFDFAGIFVFTIILGLFLWLLDSAAQGKDLRLTAPVMGVSSFVLTNSALFTVFLSHGLVLSLVVIFLMPKQAVISAAGQPYPEGAEPEAYGRHIIR